MSFLSTFLQRVARKLNFDTSVSLFVPDDGSEGAPTLGEPTPARADPLTGALRVTAVAPGGSPAPGDEDPNAPAPTTTSRLQAWDPAVDFWARVQHSVDPDLVLGDRRGLHAHVLSGHVFTQPEPTILFAVPPATNAAAQAFRVVPTDSTTTDAALCVIPPLGYWGITQPNDADRGAHVRTVGLVKSDLYVGGSIVDGTNPVPTNDDALNTTATSLLARLPPLAITGAQRPATLRSLSYVQHDPGQMTALGGAVAYNTRCDFLTLGGGSLEYMIAKRAVRLAVSGASGAIAAYRQRMWNPAVPGTMQVATFAVPFDAPRTNQETRAGCFDEFDGVCLLQTVAGLFLAIRSSVGGSPIETTTPIVGLDPALDNIVEIRYLWPAGGVEVWANGVRLLFVSKAAGASVPWMRRPNLPFTVEIKNVGASSDGFVDVIYFDVHCEGADKLNRSPSTIPVTAASIGTGGKLLVQARARQTYDLGTITGIPNRNVYIPRQIHIETTDGPLVIRCYANGTTNGAEVWTPATQDPTIEIDQTATFTGATGTIFAGGTINDTTGSCEIKFIDPELGAFATTSGAYFGSEILQIVGFARVGNVDSADIRIEIEKWW